MGPSSCGRGYLNGRRCPNPVNAVGFLWVVHQLGGLDFQRLISLLRSVATPILQLAGSPVPCGCVGHRDLGQEPSRPSNLQIMAVLVRNLVRWTSIGRTYTPCWLGRKSSDAKGETVLGRPIQPRGPVPIMSA